MNNLNNLQMKQAQTGPVPTGFESQEMRKYAASSFKTVVCAPTLADGRCPTEAEFLAYHGREPDSYEKPNTVGLAFHCFLAGSSVVDTGFPYKITQTELATHMFVSCEKRIEILRRLPTVADRAKYLAVWTALDENESIDLTALTFKLTERKYRRILKRHITPIEMEALANFNRKNISGVYWNDPYIQDGCVVIPKQIKGVASAERIPIESYFESELMFQVRSRIHAAKQWIIKHLKKQPVALPQEA